MSPSGKTRRTGLALFSAAATATAIAAAVPAAHAAAPASSTVSYQCQIFSTTFAYDAAVTVTAPATASVGDEVTVTADFSDLPGVAPLPVNSWRTNGTLTVRGAQSGSVPISVPERQGPIAPRAPIPIGTATGKVKLTAPGEVTLAPAALTITADAGAEAAIDCVPQGVPEPLATIRVEEGGGEPSEPVVTVSPASVERGGALTVGGSGWEAGAATLALCGAGGTDCRPGDLTGATAAADAGGKLTGSATVAKKAATGDRTLVVTQGALRGSVPVRITAAQDPPPGGCSDGDDGCGGTDEQTVKLTVNGGPLTMSREPGEVTLAPVTLDGTEQSTTGELRKVSVVDARGGTSGWSLTGVLTDFGGPGGAKIPAGNLSWNPSCTPGAGATPVTPGTAGPLDTTTAATLCNGAGASGVVGGTYQAGAGLELKVPPATRAGQYTAVLTLTLS